MMFMPAYFCSKRLESYSLLRGFVSHGMIDLVGMYVSDEIPGADSSKCVFSLSDSCMKLKDCVFHCALHKLASLMVLSRRKVLLASLLPQLIFRETSVSEFCFLL